MEEYFKNPDLLYKLIQDSDFPDIYNLCHTNTQLAGLCDDPLVKPLIGEKYSQYMDREIEREYLEFAAANSIGNYLLRDLPQEDKNLYVMVYIGDIPAITYLVKHKKLDLHRDNDILMDAASGGGHVDSVQFLLDNGLDPAAHNNAPIQSAASKGNIEVVKLLLKDPRVDPVVGGNWPLRVAVIDGNLDLVKILVNDPRVYNGDLWRAFSNAIDTGKSDIAGYLLGTGRINAAAYNNYAIRLAAQLGDKKIVSLLLQDKNVDPTADNNAALVAAERNGDTEVVKLLKNDPRVQGYISRMNDMSERIMGDRDTLYQIIRNSDYPTILNLISTNREINSLARENQFRDLIKQKKAEYESG